ncbi:hypothetical protein WT83_04990 [Burkholderia territorii]|uniref:Uncharacterized protein n=2 Tax=Burkholderia territorii TaxID=1503055 RepID=A0A108F2X1_9BURK|nr:hypothetical protein WT83_04990 [Burkholderia territorii]
MPSADEVLYFMTQHMREAGSTLASLRSAVEQHYPGADPTRLHQLVLSRLEGSSRVQYRALIVTATGEAQGIRPDKTNGSEPVSEPKKSPSPLDRLREWAETSPRFPFRTVPGSQDPAGNCAAGHEDDDIAGGWPCLQTVSLRDFLSSSPPGQAALSTDAREMTEVNLQENDREEVDPAGNHLDMENEPSPDDAFGMALFLLERTNANANLPPPTHSVDKGEDPGMSVTPDGAPSSVASAGSTMDDDQLSVSSLQSAAEQFWSLLGKPVNVDDVQVCVTEALKEIEKLLAELAATSPGQPIEDSFVDSVQQALNQLVATVVKAQDSYKQLLQTEPDGAVARAVLNLLGRFVMDARQLRRPYFRRGGERVDCRPHLLDYTPRWQTVLKTFDLQLYPYTYAGYMNGTGQTANALQPKERASVADFLSVLKEIGQLRFRDKPFQEQIMAGLLRRGRWIPAPNILPWLALARPALFAHLPGLENLERLVTTLAKAYQHDHAVLTDAKQLMALIREAIGEGPAARSTLAFLLAYSGPVSRFLMYQVTGKEPDAQSLRDATRLSKQEVARLVSRIEALAPAIRTFVEQWSTHGFAAEEKDLRALLECEGLSIPEKRLRLIPAVLADQIACDGPWYFPVGQGPKKTHQFRTFALSTRLFRGTDAAAPDEDPDGSPNQAAGIARALRRLYPEGCPLPQVVDILARMAPVLSTKKQQDLVYRWADRRLLVSIGGDRWVVNPDILCAAASEALVQGCKVPREAWPDADIANDADVWHALFGEKESTSVSTPGQASVPPWVPPFQAARVPGSAGLAEAVSNVCRGGPPLRIAARMHESPEGLAALLPILDQWGQPQGIRWCHVQLSPLQWQVLNAGALDNLLERAVIQTFPDAAERLRRGGSRFYARLRYGREDLTVVNGEVVLTSQRPIDHKNGFNALLGGATKGDPSSFGQLAQLIGCVRLPGIAALCMAPLGTQDRLDEQLPTPGARLGYLHARLYENGRPPAPARLVDILADEYEQTVQQTLDRLPEMLPAALERIASDPRTSVQSAPVPVLLLQWMAPDQTGHRLVELRRDGPDHGWQVRMPAADINLPEPAPVASHVWQQGLPRHARGRLLAIWPAAERPAMAVRQADDISMGAPDEATSDAGAALPETEGARKTGRQGRHQFEATARAGYAGQVFGILYELHQSNALGPYLKEKAGEQVFDVAALTPLVRQQYPAISKHALTDILKDLPPDQLERVYLTRQWEKRRFKADSENIARHELDAVFQRLRQDLPFIHYMSRSDMAALINRYELKNWCDGQDLETYFSSCPQPSSREAIRSKINELVDNGEIYRFYSNGRAPQLDAAAIQNYLVLEGLRVDGAVLQDLLPAVEQGLERLPFMSSNVHDSAQNKQKSVRKLMEALRVQQSGDRIEMPTWEEYLAVFEHTLCVNRAGVRVQYSGNIAMELYKALARELARRHDRTAWAVPPVQQAVKRLQQPNAQPVKRRPAPTQAFTPVPARPETVRQAGNMASTDAPATQASAPGSVAATTPVMTVPSTTAANPAWADFTAPLGRFWRQGSSASGNHGALTCLFDAVNNLCQGGAVEYAMPKHLHYTGAELLEVLRETTTPDGKPWVLLKVPQRQFAALAAHLFAELDAAVLFKGNANQTMHTADRSLGHFVAVRRVKDTLYLLDGQRNQPVPVTVEDSLRVLGTNDGQLWAAVPVVACRNAVGRCVSYSAVPGFMEACDAIQGVLGGPLPLDEFATWLDKQYLQGWVDHLLSHEDLHQVRRATFPRIGLEHMRQFLAERTYVRWDSRPFPLTVQEGEAPRFSVEPYLLIPGATVVLRVPFRPMFVTLQRSLDGEIHAWLEGRRVSWSEGQQQLERYWQEAVADIGGNAAIDKQEKSSRRARLAHGELLEQGYQYMDPFQSEWAGAV